MYDHLRKILSARPKKCLYNPELKNAAVLVPLFNKNGELHILFIKRSNSVFYHKGQISFPGGRVQSTDTSLKDAALRESWEEIGLLPGDTELIGELDDTPTRKTGFLISPFVALIPYPYPFTLSPEEIVGIIEVPLSSLLDKSSYKRRRVNDEGESITASTYQYKGQIIWGATARIVKQLLDLLNHDGKISSLF